MTIESNTTQLNYILELVNKLPNKTTQSENSGIAVVFNDTEQISFVQSNITDSINCIKSNDNLILVGTDNSLYYSTDGINYTKSDNINTCVHCICYYDKWFVGTEDGLYISEDGKTFEYFDDTATKQVYYDGNVLLMSTYEGVVYSDDLEVLHRSNLNLGVKSFTKIDGILYATTNEKIYKSINGITWLTL